MSNIIIGLTLLVGLLTGYVASFSQDTVLGSVVDGQAYTATSTKDQLGNSISDYKVLKSSGGVYGAFVITGANAGIVFVYDATTTDATQRTNTATTTIASYPTNLVAGEYPCECSFGYGLLIDYGSGIATGTISWK
jgi:hypothetical protein